MWGWWGHSDSWSCPQWGRETQGADRHQELWYWEWVEVFSPHIDWKDVRYFLLKRPIVTQIHIHSFLFTISSFELCFNIFFTPKAQWKYLELCSSFNERYSNFFSVEGNMFFYAYMLFYLFQIEHNFMQTGPMYLYISMNIYYTDIINFLNSGHLMQTFIIALVPWLIVKEKLFYHTHICSTCLPSKPPSNVARCISIAAMDTSSSKYIPQRFKK